MQLADRIDPQVYYKERAKRNQSAAGGDKKALSPNWAEPIKQKIDTREEISKIAGIGHACPPARHPHRAACL